MIWKQFLRYLNFFGKSREEGTEKNINTKLMHGINRISIVMFLFCMGVIVFRALTK